MSRRNSKRGLYKSLLCDIHNKDGYITRQKMVAAFEYSFSERCNSRKEMYGGNMSAYNAWVKKAASRERRELWDWQTVDEEGSVEKMKTFGHDRERDVYVYLCKLKTKDACTVANRVVEHEDKQAQAFVHAVNVKKAGVASQQKWVEKQERYNAWNAQNPSLFPYDEAVNGGQQNVR